VIGEITRDDGVAQTLVGVTEHTHDTVAA